MIECRASRGKFVPSVLDQSSLTADQVNDRTPVAIKPVTGKAEIGPATLGQSQYIAVKGTRRLKILTQDCDMVEPT